MYIYRSNAGHCTPKSRQSFINGTHFSGENLRVFLVAIWTMMEEWVASNGDC